MTELQKSRCGLSVPAFSLCAAGAPLNSDASLFLTCYESSPGQVSMPVSYILQLGLCHPGAPGLSHHCHDTGCTFQAAECCSVETYSHDFVASDVWRADICVSVVSWKLLPVWNRQIQSSGSAAGLSPESHKLKASHRYPTFTRCHCRHGVITISATHETFMARWQRGAGRHPNFLTWACHFLLFPTLMVWAEILQTQKPLIAVTWCQKQGLNIPVSSDCFYSQHLCKEGRKYQVENKPKMKNDC